MYSLAQIKYVNQLANREYFVSEFKKSYKSIIYKTTYWLCTSYIVTWLLFTWNLPNIRFEVLTHCTSTKTSNFLKLYLQLKCSESYPIMKSLSQTMFVQLWVHFLAIFWLNSCLACVRYYIDSSYHSYKIMYSLILSTRWSIAIIEFTESSLANFQKTMMCL